MPRLFVAVDLPATAIAELIRIQPRPVEGMRLVDPAQMHLTLHFLGEADLELTKSSLRTISVPTFSLTLEGVGQFPSAGGGSILWAGVRENPTLLRLHADVGLALAGQGFQPEARPYTPHMTLARSKQKVGEEVTTFLARHSSFFLPDQPISTLGLYSSTIIDDVPVYCCEQSIPVED